MLEPHQVYALARDQAFLRHFSFREIEPLIWLLLKLRKSLRFPDNTSFVFNHLWSKTLHQSDQNVFALKTAVNKLIFGY